VSVRAVDVIRKFGMKVLINMVFGHLFKFHRYNFSLVQRTLTLNFKYLSY
jgi:hypothetical protein